ncbi:MAG: putative Ig domain-containing protein, partial [Planctomycetota bacterium]
MSAGNRPAKLALACGLALCAWACHAASLTVSTFAGPPYMPGAIDATPGNESDARFRSPNGVAVDSSGNVYVADTANYTIRMISSLGVTTLAGLAGSPGRADGTGSTARFGSPVVGGPCGVAVDGSGNVYVADTGNHTIRKITPAGVVSTLAGLAGQLGHADGPALQARFDQPQGVAVDTSGNVYVADTYNYTIRKISPAGNVTTLAGQWGQSGHVGGVGIAAKFSLPRGVVVDASGNVYVSDVASGGVQGSTIRMITPAGLVSTLAGAYGQTDGFADGQGSAARFSYPGGLAVDGSGNVYVADTGNGAIRRVTPLGVVDTLGGPVLGPYNNLDDPALSVKFIGPQSVAVDSAGNVYVADTGNHTIKQITPLYDVSTIAGPLNYPGYNDTIYRAPFYNPDARFRSPAGVAVSSNGNVYVADTGNSAIRAITPLGDVSTLASGFNSPHGLAVDRSGTVYVAETTGGTISYVTPAGVVIKQVSGFNSPQGVAVDGSGTVYVADTTNCVIKKITPAGAVSTLAGQLAFSGSDDGPGNEAQFRNPCGVAVDGSGTVYVADTGNHTIRKITSGYVTTVAGTPGAPGNTDGFGPAARFCSPTGVAVTTNGNLLVADADLSSHLIRLVTPAGDVTTLAGQAGIAGSVDGTGSVALFNYPHGVAVDPWGVVYIADTSNNIVRRGTVTIEDHATISAPTGQVGVDTLQLDTDPQTAVSWQWSIIRIPSGSSASLSPDPTVRNPQFTPDIPDLYIFQLLATDALGNSSISTVQLVGTDPPTITSPPAITGIQGQPFTYQITATNNPGSYDAANLPPGLSVNASTGTITGIPTVIGVPSPAVNGKVTASTSTTQFTINVLVAVNQFVYMNTGALAGEVQQISAFNSATGQVTLVTGFTDKPAVGDTFTIWNTTISATNDSGTDTKPLSITIVIPPPVITSGTIATGIANRPFSYQITATNISVPVTGTVTTPTNPTQFTATGLINAPVAVNQFVYMNTGALAGQAQQISAFNSATGQVNVAPGFTGAPAVNDTFTIGSYAATNLPAGLVVNTSTGTITGTPTAAAVTTVGISATNTTGTGTATLTITIVKTSPGGIAWGDDTDYQTDDPGDLGPLLAVAAGGQHTVALKGDGTVAAWGSDDQGQCEVPTNPDGVTVTAVAAGYWHTAALLSDGTVEAWGHNTYTQCDVPPALSGVAAIAAGGWHTVALTSNGNVVAWGDNSHGQCTVPPGLTVTAISAGYLHTAALLSDGTVKVWGDNSYGQCNVPANPPGLTVTAISAGYWHTVALKSDLTVVAWGNDSYGQCSQAPAGLNGVSAIAAGGGHTVALKGDGTVWAWGKNDKGQCTVNAQGQCTVPPPLDPVTTIAAGDAHTVALLNPKPAATVTLDPTTIIQTYDGTPKIVSYTANPAYLYTATPTYQPTTNLSYVNVTYSGGPAPSAPGQYAVAATVSSWTYTGQTTGTLTILKSQTITFNPLPIKATGDPDFDPGATSNIGYLTVTYGSDNWAVAAIIGGKVHIGIPGTATITAYQAGDATVGPADPVSQTLFVEEAQTISFGPLQDQTFGALPVVVSASASSNLPVVLAITFGPATSNGNLVAKIAGVTTTSMALTLTGVGTVKVVASQPGDGANWAPATTVTQSFVVNPGDQTITFPSIPAKSTTDPDFDPVATASSGLPVSYGSSDHTIATIVSGLVHIVGTVGTCTITASQPGNANYNPAADVPQTLTVKQGQTITFVPSPILPQTFSVPPPLVPISASSTSNLPVAFSLVSGPATLGLDNVQNIAGIVTTTNTITITGAGSVTVKASQAGNAGFGPAQDVPQTFTVNKGNQTITINPAPLPNPIYGDAPFSVSATANSNLAVSFSVSSGSAHTSGDVVTSPGGITTTTTWIICTGAGPVTLTASQAGDTNWNPVTTNPSFTVNKANQTITFGPLPTKTFTDPDFNPGATASSGLLVKYTSSDLTVATITPGGLIHITALPPNQQWTIITASQAGDANWNAATNNNVQQPLTVKPKLSQAITFGPLPDKTYGDPPFSVSATASSNLPVSFSISGPATLNGNTVTLTGAGTVTVTASQPGDATYGSAQDVPQTFTVNKASQTITFGALSDKTYGDPPFSVSATATSNLPVSFSISGPATLNGNTVTITGAGTVTVTASQAGNNNFALAPNVPQTFTVNKASQTITFGPLPGKTYGDPPFSLSATATSNLPVSFSVSGPATLSGNTVTITGAGPVAVTASQAGDNNFEV